MFSSKPSKVDYRVLGNEEKDEVLVSHRPKSAIYSHSCTIILSFGWAVTLYLYWQLNIATRRSFTPIPSEVFRPVTKVFQHDNYWSGLSRETQYHWGAQFAGMLISITHFDNCFDIPRSTGNGALWVEDPDQYGLPQGIVAEFDHPRKTEMADARFYIVSKIHEVHCLVSRYMPYGLSVLVIMSYIVLDTLALVVCRHRCQYV